MNNPTDYLALAVNLSRAQGMLTLAQIRARREREFDDEPMLLNRAEARAYNSGAW